VVDFIVIIALLYTMFKRFASQLGLVDPPEPPTFVFVQLADRTFKVEFEPKDCKGGPEKGVTVGFLRERVADVAKVGPDRIILVHRGKKLVDDKTYLVDNYVKSRDKFFALISADRLSTKSTAGSKSATPTPPPKPRSPREKVQDVLDSVEQTLKGPVEKFIKEPPSREEGREEQHRRLSELVLQKMFLLDDVEVGEDPDLRQFRRQVINKLHKYHADLDRVGGSKGIETPDGIKQDETDGDELRDSS
jgi:BAG domain